MGHLGLWELLRGRPLLKDPRSARKPARSLLCSLPGRNASTPRAWQTVACPCLPVDNANVPSIGMAAQGQIEPPNTQPGTTAICMVAVSQVLFGAVTTVQGRRRSQQQHRQLLARSRRAAIFWHRGNGSRQGPNRTYRQDGGCSSAGSRSRHDVGPEGGPGEPTRRTVSLGGSCPSQDHKRRAAPDGEFRRHRARSALVRASMRPPADGGGKRLHQS